MTTAIDEQFKLAKGTGYKTTARVNKLEAICNQSFFML